MKIYCTSCSKEKVKSKGKINAIKRYISPRINSIYKKSQKDSIQFRILSGKFGLLKPTAKIPYYEQKLKIKDLPNLIEMVRQQLSSQNINEVIFFSANLKQYPDWQPYISLIKKACSEKNISLKIKFL